MMVLVVHTAAISADEALWTELERVDKVMHDNARPGFSFNRNGNSGQVKQQIEMMRRVATGGLADGQRTPIRVACEIGFNAGHSATVWLHALSTQLKSFDVFVMPYANASAEYIRAKHPGRVEFFRGKSATTVPRFVEQVRAGAQPRCDLWFIDGDHGTCRSCNRRAPAIDLANALDAATDGAIIIADDCTRRFPAVQAAWRDLLAAGRIDHAWNRTIVAPPPGGLKGWCVGAKAYTHVTSHE